MAKERNGLYDNIRSSKCFFTYRIKGQYYIYDAVMDGVKKISKGLYEYLNYHQKLAASIEGEIDTLSKEGYFRNNPVQKIECSIGDYESAVKNGISELILQVTQMCNLKCEYCPHAQDGNKRMRLHANIHMSQEMAFRGVDFLASHSGERKSVDISFFGGEPLIEFDLIKKVVLYAERKLSNKELTFNVSTNAILLTDEKIDFFSKHKFCVGISMDGPQEIHDKNRKDWSGKGSFQKVYGNFRKLEQAVQNTKTKIVINAVLDKQCDLDEQEHFFQMLETDKVTVLPSLVDDLSSTKVHTMTDEFYWKSVYLRFLVMLGLLKKTDENCLPITSKIFNSGLNEFRQLFEEVCHTDHSVNSVLHYRFDDCGQSFKLYLNCQGEFYPTIGINEMEKDMVIGDIEQGLSTEQMECLLQMAGSYKKNCRNCPAVSYCRLGITCCIEEKGISEQIKREYCETFLQLFYEAVGLYIIKEENEDNSLVDNHIDTATGEQTAIVQNVLGIVAGIMQKETNDLENNIGIPLLSRKIGMSALELIYLLFEIEKTYGVQFNTQDVMDYGFCSIEKIAELIIAKRG